MHHKPKSAAILLAGVLALSLAACSPAEDSGSSRTAENANLTAADGHLYRYPATGDNKGNVKQDVTAAGNAHRAEKKTSLNRKAAPYATGGAGVSLTGVQ